MSGENTYAKDLVAKAIIEANTNPQFDPDSMGRAILGAVIAHYQSYRKTEDIAQELQFTIDNLGEDEFVITRGC